jgi:hypothetical protein
MLFRAFLPDTGRSLPVVAGQRVGKVLVVIAGKRVGTVEAAASRTVFRPAPNPAPPPGPSVLRTSNVASALRFLAAILKTLLDAFL